MHNSHIQTALIQARLDALHRAAAGVSYLRSAASLPRSAALPRAVRDRLARRITGGRPLRTNP